MVISAYLSLVTALLLGVMMVDGKIDQLRGVIIITSITAVILFKLPGYLTLIVVVILISLTIIAAYVEYISNKTIKIVLTIIICLFSLVLAIHKLPGIENVVLYKDILVSKDSYPITIAANFDKGIAGIILLLLIAQYSDSKPVIKNLIFIPVYILIVLFIGLILGLEWDLKLPSSTVQFLVTNLFFTCIAEEAFFRGMLQNRLQNVMKKYQHGTLLAIVISSILFGLAHIGGGLLITLLATVAGVFYGLIYYQTKILSAAILIHFGVNTGHFLFLTYPVPL